MTNTKTFRLKGKKEAEICVFSSPAEACAMLRGLASVVVLDGFWWKQITE